MIYQKIIILFLRIESGSHLAMLIREILSFDNHESALAHRSIYRDLSIDSMSVLPH